MPETKRRRNELAEFVAAMVIAAVVMTGAYLFADWLPFPVSFVVVLVIAGGLTVVATYFMDRPEARR